MWSICFEEIIDEIKKNVSFDEQIQDRRITRWNCKTFEQFRSMSTSDESSTRKCLALMTGYQKDLLKNMFAPEHLYNSRRAIFQSIQWCETLFQFTEVHEDATSFGWKRISAAANFDLFKSST